MSETLVIRSTRMVLPDGVRESAAYVRDKKIESIHSYDAKLSADRDVDLGDLALLPGLVDTHVHVNEPGRTEWEGFASATRAALAGGVTTICDMPLNSVPVTVSVEALREKAAAAAGQGSGDNANAIALAGLAATACSSSSSSSSRSEEHTLNSSHRTVSRMPSSA